MIRSLKKKQALLNYVYALTFSEKIVALVLVLAQFTYWPSVQVLDTTIEPAVVSGLLLSLLGVRFFGSALFGLIFYSPWKYIIGLWLYGSFISLIFTDSKINILLNILYMATILIGAISVGLLYSRNEIRFDKVLKTWLIIAMLLSPLFIVQFLLASFSDITVSRASYAVGTFAFPRVHGFSFEPLFLANWLLPPLLFCFYQLSKSTKKAWMIGASTLTLILILTLARGGLYAWLFSLILIILTVPKASKKRLLQALTLGSVSGLMLIGLSAHANNSTFNAGILRYLDHSTLGLFNQNDANNIEPTTVSDFRTETPREEIPNSEEDVTFIISKTLDSQGAVEASVKGREESVRDGLKLFTESTFNTLFGVGLFRFGEEMNQRNPSIYTDVDQVTNSQPIDLLVETGTVGLLIGFIFITVSFKNAQSKPILLRIIFVTVATQYLFFTNYFLLPLWLLLALLVVSIQMKEVQHV